MERGPRGDPHQNALPPGHEPPHGVGLLIVHAEYLVVNVPVQQRGNKAAADALEVVPARFAPGEHRRARRLHRHHPDGGVLLFQIPARAGDGAAGAHPGHKGVHPAAGIRPDLRAGGGVVGRRVGGVFKLPGHKASGDLPGQLPGPADGPLHPLGAGGQHQFRPVGGHEQLPLPGHGVRHDDDGAVAPGGGNGRQGDTRIPRGGFDDGGPGGQNAPGLRVVYHGPGRPVFGGPGGVQTLQLGQQPALQPQVPLQMRQLQQRRAADELFHGCINMSHTLLLAAQFFPRFVQSF